MEFLNNLRLRIAQYLLKKKINELNIERQSVNFKQAKRIGILFDGTNPSDRMVIQSYAKLLKKQDKKVSLLGYVDISDRSKPDLGFDYFNRTDINWLLQPKGRLVEEFMEKPFDILLSLHLSPVQPLAYVSALSRAKLRTGQSHKDFIDSYDLMIDADTGSDLQNFIGQVDLLLKSLNRND